MKDKVLDTISYLIVVLTIILAYLFKDNMMLVSLIVGVGAFAYGCISTFKMDNYGPLVTAFGLSLFISTMFYKFEFLDITDSITFCLVFALLLFMIIMFFYNYIIRKNAKEKYTVSVIGTVSDLVRNPNYKKEYYEVVYNYIYEDKEYSISHPGLFDKNVPAIGTVLNFYLDPTDPASVFFDKTKKQIMKEYFVEFFIIVVSVIIIVSLFV